MSIPGAGNPLLLGGAAGGGYKIERSLRFNSADSAYLSRTPASAGNRKTWTWAGWVKRASLSNGIFKPIFAAGSGFWAGGDQHQLGFGSDDSLLAIDYSGNGSSAFQVKSKGIYRDPAAWYHIVLSVDSTQATTTDRVKLYVNGVLDTDTSTTFPTLNSNTIVNGTVAHYLGAAPAYYGELSLADVHFIDGQALTPSSFGETDTNGIWQPKAFSGGSYGTNGFHLDFANNSTAAALGTDTSGNGNTWTVNNISVAAGNGNYISSTTGTTSPAGTSFGNMFNGSTGTFVRAAPSSTVTFTKTFTGVTTLRVYASRLGGNLRVNGTVVPNGINGTWWNIDLTSIGSTITDISFTSGTNPNLFEVYAIEVNGTVLVDNSFGAGNDSLVDSPTNYGIDTGAGGEVRGNYCTWNPLDKGADLVLSNGNLDATIAVANWRTVRASFGVSSGKWYWEITNVSASASDYTIIGIATKDKDLSFNMAGGDTATDKSVNYLTGLSQNDVVACALNMDAGTLQLYLNNVSNGPLFTGITGTWFPAISLYPAGYVSANFGQRQWAFAPPAGFKALCTQNLPAPTITKPSTVMDVALWTGNGSARSITGLGFNPDLVWIKGRSGATDHALYDSVRGATLDLVSNSTAAETTQTQGLTAFNSDGFSLGTLAKVNTNTATYAGWCWDAGSSTVTNTSGTISSQVRANASAGFSVVTWSAQASAGTVGHGLGVAPSLIIMKDRQSGGSNWLVFHASVGAGKYLNLNAAGAATTLSTIFSTAPTSTVFDPGTVFISGNGYGNQVTYCFAPVAGYSAFGSYTGNGSADGPFVYTGFRPRWLMIKSSSAPYGWAIHDTLREPYNVDDSLIYANTAGAEATDSVSWGIDILSNGFKIRTSAGVVWNNSGSTFIYAAFAEAPFALARAR